MKKNNNCAVNTAVILAAGMGSRLSPYTDNKAKCLVKVNGKTILDIKIIPRALKFLHKRN